MDRLLWETAEHVYALVYNRSFFNTLVCVLMLVVFIVFISCCSFDTLSLTIVDHVLEVLTKLLSSDSYQWCLGRVHLITITFCLTQSIFMACCINVHLIKVNLIHLFIYVLSIYYSIVSAYLLNFTVKSFFPIKCLNDMTTKTCWNGCCL